MIIVDISASSPASKAGLRSSQLQVASDGSQVPVLLRGQTFKECYSGNVLSDSH